ncbi:unnamed protein product [Brachionus calyciflorus]|uniref:Uncharacterized protein n=1 Tax=Brachionus calyciflorus TaxID=104777 RepID=A0A813ZVI7_9BILA|nr:unnamed protein product [Brachionus calyciflorus]
MFVILFVTNTICNIIINAVITDLSATDVIMIDQPIQDINNCEMPTDENSVTTKNTNQQAINNGKITLSIKRGYGSHGFCFICKRKTGSKPMMVLPIEAIGKIYLKREILILVGARSCIDHLSDKNFVKDDQLETIPIANVSIGLTSEKIEILFQSFKYREENMSTFFQKFNDFTCVTNEMGIKITGFT